VTSYYYSSPPAPEPTPTPSARRRSLGCLLEIVETLALTLLLFWVIQSFVAQPFQVRQNSMEHTIEDEQFVLVDRLTPHFDAYHRGDIVVFNPPEEANRLGDPFIKRVIGIPFDKVELRDGRVFVNGIALTEPYLYAVDGTPQPTLPEDASGTSSWIVPAGELFVMGDHRAQSSDSREFGPIEISSVIGRAWLRYWPLDTLSILPTAKHPELTSPPSSPGASAPVSSSKPSTKPKPTPKPAKTPKP
jgi:signal peptidase I